MENSQTIGAKLVALRKAKGVTQADLGTYLNISYQAVSKWERDESCPDFNTLSRIAQFFNVPIAYFENGNTETAYTATATATREMLGVCKDCGKVVYKGEEGSTSPALICKVCTNKKLAAAQTSLEKARQAEAKKQFNVKKNRNRGLVWGGITAVIMFVFMIFSVIDTDDVGATIGGGLLLTVLGFTYISQLFWDGAVLDCTLAGGKVIGTPGVIFTFDLDGFIFLIAMKILFAVIKFIVWLFTVVVCALAAIVISPFTFIPALMRVNKGVGISAKTNTQAKQFFNVVILNVPENKTQAIIAIREKTGLMLHEVAQALRVGSIFPKRFETEAEANECVSILGEYGVYAVVK